MDLDINLAVVCGRLASAPEVRTFDTGSRQMQLLVTVGTSRPRRRIDVIPVTLWDPPESLLADPPDQSDRVWIAGMVQRRGFDDPAGRRSRVEVIAEQIAILADDRIATPLPGHRSSDRATGAL